MWLHLNSLPVFELKKDKQKSQTTEADGINCKSTNKATMSPPSSLHMKMLNRKRSEEYGEALEWRGLERHYVRRMKALRSTYRTTPFTRTWPCYLPKVLVLFPKEHSAPLVTIIVLVALIIPLSNISLDQRVINTLFLAVHMTWRKENDHTAM